MTITTKMPELLLRSPDSDWNRERWEKLPDDGNRYEVIDGVLYMTTAPSSFHQWIIRQIVRLLFTQIDDAGVGITTWSPIGLFMPGCDPVQPDILVVRNSDLAMFQDSRISGIPALLIEVLSPSNPNQDTKIKRGAYARAGVPEYWIVRPAERDALVCSQPDTSLGDYAQVSHIVGDGELVSPTLPIRTKIADFFAGAPDTTL
jgi:Uma2 family endonuclease